MIERMAAAAASRVPAAAANGATLPEIGAPLGALGHVRLPQQGKAAPDLLRRRLRPGRAGSASRWRWCRKLGIELRLHSWFSRTLVEDGQVKGVVCETKSGREAILGNVVIDATGDLDVAASAGAPHISGSYIMTTVFRLGGVDTDAAERFEREEPEAFAALDREVKRMLGGSWAYWWLKTPLPGVVWCNCPHMAGPGRPQGRGPDARRDPGPRASSTRWSSSCARKLPGFERLLRGRHGAADRRAPDAPARRRVRHEQGRRDAAHPLRRQRGARPRLLLPVPRDAAAQRREPAGRRAPLFGDLGRAEDLARDPAVHGDGRGGRRRRRARARRRRERCATSTSAQLQSKLRAQGADPGDQTGPNADVPSRSPRSFAEASHERASTATTCRWPASA